MIGISPLFIDNLSGVFPNWRKEENSQFLESVRENNIVSNQNVLQRVHCLKNQCTLTQHTNVIFGVCFAYKNQDLKDKMEAARNESKIVKV